MALGVTDGAVRYWWKHDRWDTRLDTALTQRTVATTRGSQAISNLLRASLYNNMVVLNGIIADDRRSDSIRIKAISEFADICLKLKVIQPEDLLQVPKLSATPTFTDDLPGQSGLLPKDDTDDGHDDGTGDERYGTGTGDVSNPNTDPVHNEHVHDDTVRATEFNSGEATVASGIDGPTEPPAYGWGERESRSCPIDGDGIVRVGPEPGSNEE
jgi:hypothetical protein